MTTKLSLYNNALLILGERPLASLSENRKPRRLLDQVWDNGFLDRILELSDWNFAVNTIESTFDPTASPQFGYKYKHGKPADWVRTLEISLDDYFNIPYLGFTDENGSWWADGDVVYVRYISSDALFGGDLSLWPESMVAFAEYELARRINKSMSQSNVTQRDLEALTEKARNKASSIDAQAEPTQFMPLGSWARSRYGRSQRRQPRISRI